MKNVCMLPLREEDIMSGFKIYGWIGYFKIYSVVCDSNQRVFETSGISKSGKNSSEKLDEGKFTFTMIVYY